MKLYIKKAQDGATLLKILNGRSLIEIDEANQLTKNKMKGLWKGITSGTIIPTLSNIGELIESAYKHYVSPETTLQGGAPPVPALIRNPLQIVKNGRQTIKAVDLAKRKFFPIAKYGELPIYSEQTMPKIKVRNNRLSTKDNPNRDVVYLEYNVKEGKKMTTPQVFKDISKRFNESAHGRAVAFDEYGSLSSDSYPLALAHFRRWLNLGKGKFFVPESIEAKPMLRLNSLGNRPATLLTVDWINQKIIESGYNIPKAELVKDFTGRPEIRVSPIGFFKYKRGAKLLNNSQFA